MRGRAVGQAGWRRPRRGPRRAARRRCGPARRRRARRTGTTPRRRDGGRLTPGVEHRVEERRVPERLLLPGPGVVGDAVRGGVDEHRAEEVAGLLDRVGHARGRQGGCDSSPRRRPRPRRAGRTPRRRPPAAWPGRRRSRPGSRTACPPGTPARCGASWSMTSAPPAERRDRQAAADDLAEGEQVRVPALDGALEPPPAGRPDPEPGEHLVHDEQRPVLAGDAGAAPR